ncbi:MAG: DUF1841 family protein [Candidatus Competibacteraceae bacterium]|nr:DUF1841 family protein [Candidatus Competibacteraceae bacterium]MCP5124686.1 DUF1841 family protein [Gammaproteobacteria bacterium]HRX71802.1 DUF1841 family protein [Candidatus Competibacteraceae bacterium]
MFGNDRDSLRRYYCTVWEKAREDQVLEPLEQLIAGVINEHPEYQPVLTDAETALNREYMPEGGQTNPFLHMGMHIAIQEQLGGNRPVGILDVYQQLCQRMGDAHTAEHAMMECLGETLWEAQRNGQEPDERVYLERLRRLG